MKVYILYFVLMVSVCACSKNSEIISQPVDAPSTVTINGTNYPTVTIGSQVWTAANYNGAGGIEPDKTMTNAAYWTPLYGKYYSPEEAGKIVLPAGWRVPTKADFNKLIANYPLTPATATQGNIEAFYALASSLGWDNLKGTNSGGFSLYPAGFVGGTTTKPIYYQGFHEAVLLSSNSFVIVTDPQQTYYDMLHLYSSGICDVQTMPMNSTYKYWYTLRFVKDK